MTGLVGDPLLVGGLGPGPAAPPKSGPGFQYETDRQSVTGGVMLKSTTEILQRVMNAAARLIINNSDV